MDCTNEMPAADQQFSVCYVNETFGIIDQTLQRRSANYKPNIWKYDLLQSLPTEYTEEKCKREAKKLKEELKCSLLEAGDQLAKLELVDSIVKLGLASLFEDEIKGALDSVVSVKNECSSIGEDLYVTALCFRLLRQYGYNVSQDMFIGFVDEKGKFMKITRSNVKPLLELFEASNLALEFENILDEAKVFSKQYLESISSNLDERLAKELAHALEHPLHRRVEWYNVKRHIHAREKEENTNSTLMKLAKLNFNMVQASHQKDLKEISRWWRNLGLAESLSFTRDRMVESYLWAVGVAFEPQHGSFRKWLTKVIKLVLIIDDVYDIYGSLQELEQFTEAVDRWDSMAIRYLPECMKICFKTLYDTTNEIAFEIQKEKGWSSVLPHLQKAWADFCKALLVEASWHDKGYTPSLQVYLDNGWISSSGPVLSLHALFSVTHVTEDVIELLKHTHDLMHYTSLIIRLCNDQGTSGAELERGDAPSSILCYMREANVSEEIAQDHIRSIINNTWKKINNQCHKQSPLLQPFAKWTTNTARVAHFIYQNGDGFGVQDRQTKDQVLSLLIEPLALY